MNIAFVSRIVLLAAAGLLGLGGCSSAPPAPEPSSGLLSDARSAETKCVADRGALRAMGALDDDPNAPPVAQVRRAASTLSVWHLEFKDPESCDAFEMKDVFVFNTYGRFADIYAPRDRAVQQALDKAPGLIWKDYGGVATLPPPPPAEPVASRGSPENIVRGGLAKFTGKGVIIAVVDSGIDFRHPDFITVDDQGKPVSRILLFWDTLSDDHDRRGIGDEPPIVVPGGASVGTVYTREVLTEDLRAGTPKIGIKDTNGHGTACAGIAAGNGRGYGDRRYAGVAPEADLIAVRIGTGPGMENAYLLGAICSWLNDVAGDQPCVVSCSFGGQYGGRDGAHVLERQLDAQFPPDADGRVLCIAAGNDGQRRLHAEIAISSTAGRLEWIVPDEGQGEVYICFATDDLRKITWNSVGRTPITKNRLSSGIHGLTGQGWVTISCGPGTYAIEFTTPTGSVVADAYISGGSSRYTSAFTPTCASAGKQISTPATTGQAISVGSYDFNDLLDMNGKKTTYGNPDKGIAPLTIGGISRYSNPGPRRRVDAVKPELVAPGQFHTAARTSANTADSSLVESSGKYVYFNGTSAATPYCAGIFALMLQKRPDLNGGDFRELLKMKLSRDARTGKTPNALWGYGKLDLQAARALLAAVNPK